MSTRAIRLLFTVSILALGVFTQKLLDLGLEIFLAAEWGASAQRDAYLATTPVLVAASFAEMSLLPYAIREGQRGAALSDTLKAAISVMPLFAGILWLGSIGLWAGRGHDGAAWPEFLLSGLGFVVIVTLLVPLTIDAGLRVAQGRYWLAALRLPLVSVAMLAGALVLPLGIAAPAAGGAVGLTLFTVGTASPRSFFGWPRARALVLLGAALSFAAYPLLSRILIERVILSGRGDGTLAVLDFAEKATGVFGLMSVAILGPAILSTVGAASPRRGALLAFSILAPLALLVALFAEPLVRLLFERGEFTAEDTQAVARLVRVLSWSIPFIGALPLLAPDASRSGLHWVALAVGAASALHIVATVAANRGADPAWVALSFNAGMTVLFLLAFARVGERSPEGAPHAIA